MNTKQKAEFALAKIKSGSSIESVIDELGADKQSWFRISSKAYSINLEEARKKRDKDVKKPNVSATSNREIEEILDLNNQLANYALSIPALSTRSDIDRAKELLAQMPSSEQELIFLVEEMTLAPRIRALQNVGRLRHFNVFKEFSQLIEAATLCYYRANYASAYLTLVPVIEGIILRWCGYTGTGSKPEFKYIRQFFDLSHTRTPCPGNPLFHDVFSKVCSKIINEHLYKPSQSGVAYSEFNRHQASHLLRDVKFATRENCIRLFLLMDTMTELYHYETFCADPRWDLKDSDIVKEVTVYGFLLLEHTNPFNAERELLSRSI